MEAIETIDIRADFNIGRLHVTQLLKWIISSNTVHAKKILNVERAKASGRSKLLNLTMSASSPGLNLQEIDTEQIQQILRTSLAVAAYAVREPPEREFFYSLFRVGKRSVALIDMVQFLHMVLSMTRRGFVATLDIKTSSVFEIYLFFHSIAIAEKAIQAKALKDSHSFLTKTLFGYTTPKILKSWTAPAEATNLVPLAKLVSPYTLFDSEKKR